jgi:hypothetical protein
VRDAAWGIEPTHDLNGRHLPGGRILAEQPGVGSAIAGGNMPTWAYSAATFQPVQRVGRDRCCSDSSPPISAQRRHTASRASTLLR